MRISHPFLTTTIVASTLALGCGGKQKPKTKAPAPATPTSKRTASPEVQKTERATGEIREAMLHLRRVHFGFDTSALMSEARVALGEAAELLAAHPDVDIYIDGHTDVRGTSGYNLALGERRAQAAADYLMRLGIAKQRLFVVTHGKEQLWDDAATEVANAKNRRAEFRLKRGNVRLVLGDGVLYNDKGRRLAASEM